MFQQPPPSSQAEPSPLGEPSFQGEPSSQGEPSAQQRPKRIFILADGTWKSQASNDDPPTNVFRFRACLDDMDVERRMEQFFIYQPGIGIASTGGRIRRLFVSVAGGGFGRGIGVNIMFLYAELARQYNRGDLLYFLGFSRGAYTVRCLLDLVATMGILDWNQVQPASRDRAINELYTAWKAFARASGNRALPALQYPMHRQVTLDACSVWDTVSSIGPPRFRRVLLGLNPFRNVAVTLHREVRYGFQALALSEHRENFRAMVWPTATTQIQRIKQCWFLGPHSSVGGGSSQMSNNIANATLRWICAELSANLGVGIDQNRLDILTRLSPNAVQFGIPELESSFALPISVSGSVPRTPGVPDPNNQRVHITVRQWDRFLTLTQRPSILDRMFLPDDPKENEQGIFQWTTRNNRIILEDQPNEIERVEHLVPHFQPEGRPVVPIAQGGEAAHYGHPTLPFDTTEPEITGGN